MATLNISFTFSSDNGDAEDFVSFSEADYLNAVYDSGEGNPAGSSRIDSAKVTTAFGRKFNFKTFEAWGIPAGATIDSITNWTIDGAYFETGASNGTNFIGGGIAVGGSSSVVRYSYTDPPALGDWAWQTIPLQDIWDGPFPAASTDNLFIFLDADMNLGAGGAGSSHHDNISFDINYTPLSPGETASGALQAQNATMSGVATVEPIIYASGALQAQDAAISGFCQALPSVHETVASITQDVYLFDADGVTVPFIRFNVRREGANESAVITAPLEYKNILIAAAAVTINVQSFDVYGVETQFQLFTGTVDTFITSSNNQITLNCTGAATWPANAVRDFANVSYNTDDGNYYSYRTKVDPRFYPGDVGMFGLRRININRVLFSVNEQQAFMELADIGQV